MFWIWIKCIGDCDVCVWWTYLQVLIGLEAQKCKSINYILLVYGFLNSLFSCGGPFLSHGRRLIIFAGLLGRCPLLPFLHPRTAASVAAACPPVALLRLHYSTERKKNDIKYLSVRYYSRRIHRWITRTHKNTPRSHNHTQKFPSDFNRGFRGGFCSTQSSHSPTHTSTVKFPLFPQQWRPRTHTRTHRGRVAHAMTRMLLRQFLRQGKEFFTKFIITVTDLIIIIQIFFLGASQTYVSFHMRLFTARTTNLRNRKIVFLFWVIRSIYLAPAKAGIETVLINYYLVSNHT